MTPEQIDAAYHHKKRELEVNAAKAAIYRKCMRGADNVSLEEKEQRHKYFEKCYGITLEEAQETLADNVILSYHKKRRAHEDDDWDNAAYIALSSNTKKENLI